MNKLVNCGLENRFGTNCLKWDGLKSRFGNENLIAMWVADMDFKAPQPVIDALKERVNHGIFGYNIIPDSYYEAFINWEKEKHGYNVKKEWIRFSPGVVPALFWFINILTNPGDSCIVMGPVYYPFHDAIKENETVYLPISEMKDVYDIQIDNIADSKIIVIDSLEKEQVQAKTKSDVSVKAKKEGFSKTVDKIEKDNQVIVIKNNNNEISEKGWTKIRTQSGMLGYVKTSKLDEITTTREAKEQTKQITGKVDMFWDYYSQYVKAPDRTGQVIDGINVVSPSFFYLDKNDGTLKDNVGDAGIAYINWAHSNGYKVWPMISNADAGIKVTSTILNSYSKRQQLIQSIVEKCAKYDIDGINIDFENMYEADKDKYSRFIIELVPRMLEMKIVTSVDVTAPDGDPNWSLCFDRNVLGHVADYLVFMAYDQYGASSSKPGTTAGLNWVETSLKKIIDYDEVDTNKIILGMPLYTRQWTITQDGTIKDRSVISMMNIKIPNNVEKQWDDTLKQYYIEYASGKNTIKMWIEDGTSIKEKVSLVTKYNLGGASCWKKDMETSNIWTIIKDELKKNDTEN